MNKLIRHKGIWVLAAALSLSLIAAALSVFFAGSASPLGEVAQGISRPFQTMIELVDLNLSHVSGQALDYQLLLEENQKLQAEVSALQDKVRQASIATQENARLRELLAFKQMRRDLTFAPAKILSLNSDNWSRSLTINQGETDGIEASDCVVDAFGSFLGVVTEVGNYWSTVDLLTDPTFEMGGEVVSSGERGLLTGDVTLMPSGQLKLSLLARDSKLKVGDCVQSFASEAVYPSGLLVGTVSSVEVDPSGLHSYAIITPAAELDRLTQVFVITDFSIEE